MKRVLIAFTLALLCLCGAGAGDTTPQQRYVEKYAPMAVREMLRSGVPASITLAQGMLESGNGDSKLATKGKNHFGIKCHKGWTGKSMKVDDDARGECFRVYDSVEESYRDHSDFLRYRDRYKFLFDLDRTDYKGWAYGLKKAGYATDPSYASKLIQCVEDYDLGRFDRMTVAQALSIGGADAEAPAGKEESEVIPESPLKMEAAEVYTGPVKEQFSVSLSRTMYSKNGVPFVYALEGETYAVLAKKYHLFEREILRFNDQPRGAELHAGDVVYLEPKKSKTVRGLDKYIVGSDDETFHGICQRFAVTEKAIRKLNGFSASYVPREGDEIVLRPESKWKKLWKKR